MAAAIPSFAPFNPNTQLLTDYRSIFMTFIEVISITDDKISQIF